MANLESYRPTTYDEYMRRMLSPFDSGRWPAHIVPMLQAPVPRNVDRELLRDHPGNVIARFILIYDGPIFLIGLIALCLAYIWPGTHTYAALFATLLFSGLSIAFILIACVGMIINFTFRRRNVRILRHWEPLVCRIIRSGSYEHPKSKSRRYFTEIELVDLTTGKLVPVRCENTQPVHIMRLPLSHEGAYTTVLLQNTNDIRSAILYSDIAYTQEQLDAELQSRQEQRKTNPVRWWVRYIAILGAVYALLGLWFFAFRVYGCYLSDLDAAWLYAIAVSIAASTLVFCVLKHRRKKLLAKYARQVNSSSLVDEIPGLAEAFAPTDYSISHSKDRHAMIGFSVFFAGFLFLAGLLPTVNAKLDTAAPMEFDISVFEFSPMRVNDVIVMHEGNITLTTGQTYNVSILPGEMHAYTPDNGHYTKCRAIVGEGFLGWPWIRGIEPIQVR